MNKDLNKESKKYLDDPRWKECERLSLKGEFNEANKPSNKIVASYSDYARSNSKNI